MKSKIVVLLTFESLLLVSLCLGFQDEARRDLQSVTESLLWDRLERMPTLERPMIVGHARLRVHTVDRLTVSPAGAVEHTETACGLSHRLIDTASLNFLKGLKFSPCFYEATARRITGYLTIDYDMEREPTLGIHLPPVRLLENGKFRINQESVVDLNGLLDWLKAESAVERTKIVHLVVPLKGDLSVLRALREAGLEDVHLRFLTEE